MRIILLGTGTPNPSLSRMGAGYLVVLKNHVLAFDHGPGSFHRLMETDVSPTQVTHLFFSHLHYDHCLDYARLVLTRWDQGAGAIPELNVFGPSYTGTMTELLFGENGVFAPDIMTRIRHEPSLQTFISRGGTPPRKRPEPRFQTLEHGDVIQEGEWRVEVTNVPHAQPHLECFGFRLDASEGSFAYSGDAGYSEGFARFIRGCDVLVHMCHYLSGTEPGPEWAKGAAGHLEAARVAQEADVKTLVLSHIPNQMDLPGIRERVIKEVSRVFDGNVFWGEDLMEIPVKGPKEKKHTG